MKSIDAAESQLNRILSEFPWLWAVDSIWCYLFNKVVIKNLEEKVLSRRTPSPCWIKTRGLYNRESAVIELSTFKEEKLIYSIETKLARSGQKTTVEYILIRDSFEEAWPADVGMPANPGDRRFYKNYTLYRCPDGLIEKVIQEKRK